MKAYGRRSKSHLVGFSKVNCRIGIDGIWSVHIAKQPFLRVAEHHSNARGCLLWSRSIHFTSTSKRVFSTVRHPHSKFSQVSVNFYTLPNPFEKGCTRSIGTKNSGVLKTSQYSTTLKSNFSLHNPYFPTSLLSKGLWIVTFDTLFPKSVRR